jgi:uroporphyrinogen decarboxylase
MFGTPDLAAEITLLPKRFGVDALIIFQDILTPLTPMGLPFVFRPGPVLEEPIRSEADLGRLREFDPHEELDSVAETIRLVSREVDGELPILGFAGAPFTLAAFILEGGSPGSKLDRTRSLMEEQPGLVHALLERLAAMTGRYLRMQIDTGVHAVQLFESCADLISFEEYQSFAQPYEAAVMNAIEGTVPRILFAKERPWLDAMAATGADVLSVGRCVDLREARQQLGGGVALQGNVDNQILAEGTPDDVEAATRECIVAGGRQGHILNLNHGVLRRTPVENVQRLIDICRSTALDPAGSGDEQRM